MCKSRHLDHEGRKSQLISRLRKCKRAPDLNKLSAHAMAIELKAKGLSKTRFKRKQEMLEALRTGWVCIVYIYIYNAMCVRHCLFHCVCLCLCL